jgi:choloylglycine hydrolase
MNEAGLVVEIMWLKESEYPPPDEHPTVNELQWVQYQLDNFATVTEVAANAERLRKTAFFVAFSLMRRGP